MLVFTLVAILLHGMKTSDTIIVSRTEDLGGWLSGKLPKEKMLELEAALRIALGKAETRGLPGLSRAFTHSGRAP